MEEGALGHVHASPRVAYTVPHVIIRSAKMVRTHVGRW